jgi:hypothetical protein
LAPHFLHRLRATKSAFAVVGTELPRLALWFNGPCGCDNYVRDLNPSGRPHVPIDHAPTKQAARVVELACRMGTIA